MDKISLERKISGFKIHLLSNHPFFATVVLNLVYVVDEGNHYPASTDGYKKVYLHPDIDKLSLETFKFINMHELLHIILMHSQRRGDRDPFLWGVACDYATNSILIDEMKMNAPDELPCLYNEMFSKNKMTAEKIYEILLLQKSREGKVTLQFSDGSKVEVTEADVSGLVGKILAPGDFSDSKNPKEEQERIKEILVQANIMHEKMGKMKGSLPSSIVEYIKQIIKPKIPFERLLARYTSEVIAGKGEYTYNPVNKKYAFYYDVVMPSIAKEEVPKVVVAVDSSASISSHDLKLAAGAIKRLASLTQEITVIVCDCKIQQVIKTNEIEEFLKNVKFKGRGGTSHIPVFEYIDQHIKNPDVVICITDGYTEYPEKQPRYPVIWLLTKDHDEPPWGRKVIMSED